MVWGKGEAKLARVMETGLQWVLQPKEQNGEEPTQELPVDPWLKHGGGGGERSTEDTGGLQGRTLDFGETG